MKLVNLLSAGVKPGDILFTATGNECRVIGTDGDRDRPILVLNSKGDVLSVTECGEAKKGFGPCMFLAPLKVDAPEEPADVNWSKVFEQGKPFMMRDGVGDKWQKHYACAYLSSASDVPFVCYADGALPGFSAGVSRWRFARRLTPEELNRHDLPMDTYGA